MLLTRDVPVVPALQFEWASIEYGPQFGMGQRVIDGHKETLEGGAESADGILKAGGRLGMGGDYGFPCDGLPTFAPHCSRDSSSNMILESPIRGWKVNATAFVRALLGPPFVFAPFPVATKSQRIWETVSCRA